MARFTKDDATVETSVPTHAVRLRADGFVEVQPIPVKPVKAKADPKTITTPDTPAVDPKN